MTNKLSLYFHIPFCIKKCAYCAFYSLANQKDELKQAYFEALCNQVNFLQTEKEIQTIYFGGGTPPTLCADRLCKLLSLIKKRFTLSRDCEITIEINPNSIDFQTLCQLRAAGFNRLSIGIQSANDEVLAKLGRTHSFADAKRCIVDARKAGFNNISADVIFALPFQTDEEFERGLREITSTSPDHISAYSLQLEEGTALYARRAELEFPDEDSEERQYNFLCSHLKSQGYTHYEVSSFAKEGFESRHNLNYWACGEYFGFGVGAHSFYCGKRFSSECDIRSYIEKSAISLYAPTDCDSAPFLTQEELAEEKILLGLRTRYGALIPESKKLVGIKVHSLGYGSYDCGRLTLNSRGFRVSNAIIADVLG